MSRCSLLLLAMVIAALTLEPCDAESLLPHAVMPPRPPARVPAASSKARAPPVTAGRRQTAVDPVAPPSATAASQHAAEAPPSATAASQHDFHSVASSFARSGLPGAKQPVGALLKNAVFLPKECYDRDGRTRPCLMLWHSGEGKPYTWAMWAGINGQPVGHAALWIGGSDVQLSPSNVDDKENYVSWWPIGEGGEVSKEDLNGPANPHSYRQDLAATAEGRTPDEVLPLVGWDSKRMKEFYQGVLKRENKYQMLGKNCVCVTFELLERGVPSDNPATDDPEKHHEVAAKAFKTLTTGWLRFFKPKTPYYMQYFVDAYADMHSNCPVCNSKGCKRLPPAPRRPAAPLTAAEEKAIAADWLAAYD